MDSDYKEMRDKAFWDRDNRGHCAEKGGNQESVYCPSHQLKVEYNNKRFWNRRAEAAAAAVEAAAAAAALLRRHSEAGQPDTITQLHDMTESVMSLLWRKKKNSV